MIRSGPEQFIAMFFTSDPIRLKVPTDLAMVNMLKAIGGSTRTSSLFGRSKFQRYEVVIGAELDCNKLPEVTLLQEILLRL